MESASIFNYVFCDLDGTLLEDSMRHYRCYQDIVRYYGGTCISKEEYWNDKRNKVKRTILLEKTHFKGTYNEYLAAWNDMIEMEKYLQFETVRPDTTKVLKWLRRNSQHLELVTMRQNREVLEKQLSDIGIIQFFEKIRKGDPIRESKADLFHEQYGRDSIVIGDTEADQQLARKIGSSFVAFTSGLRDAIFFRDEMYCIRSLNEIMLLDFQFDH